jgi:hypothetical protein
MQQIFFYEEAQPALFVPYDNWFVLIDTGSSSLNEEHKTTAGT